MSHVTKKRNVCTCSLSPSRLIFFLNKSFHTLAESHAEMFTVYTHAQMNEMAESAIFNGPSTIINISDKLHFYILPNILVKKLTLWTLQKSCHFIVFVFCNISLSIDKAIYCCVLTIDIFKKCDKIESKRVSCHKFRFKYVNNSRITLFMKVFFKSQIFMTVLNRLTWKKTPISSGKETYSIDILSNLLTQFSSVPRDAASVTLSGSSVTCNVTQTVPTTFIRTLWSISSIRTFCKFLQFFWNRIRYTQVSFYFEWRNYNFKPLLTTEIFHSKNILNNEY